MDTQPTIEIDLKEYGDQSGAKVMLAEPTFRKMRTAKNEARRCIATANIDNRKGLSAEDLLYGDLEIVTAMSFVKEAPFEPTLEGFLFYTDMIDGIKIGNGEALFDRIKADIEKLKKGEMSPLPN